jgi:hypothetical protein
VDPACAGCGDRLARARAEDGVLGDQGAVEVDGEGRDVLRKGLGQLQR